MTTIIRSARVVGPRKVTQADITLEGGRIVAIGKASRSSGAKVMDASGLYALPGFIDPHVHGGLGFDATMGAYDAKTNTFDGSAEVFRTALPRLMKRFARTGVTRALLSTMAAPMDRIRAALGHLADYVESPANGTEGTRLMGSFIEGTFLKRKEYAGAQNPENFRTPSAGEFDKLNRAARGTIQYVNIAPEYGDSALKLIRYLTKKGVLAGVGHSSCPADHVLKCAKAGLRVSVHFLNGPTGMSYKPFHGGNVQELFLRDSDLYVETIGDGWHIAPPYVMDVLRRKGAERVVAVTDAMFVAGVRGISDFTVDGIEGAVHSSGKYLHTKRDPATLFGSVLDMSTAFGNFMSWLTSGMEGVWTPAGRGMNTEAAMAQVARMCATNAAHLLHADQPGARNAPPGGTGTLEKGRCADIVLAKLIGKPGHFRLSVKHTFVEGVKVV